MRLATSLLLLAVALESSTALRGDSKARGRWLQAPPPPTDGAPPPPKDGIPPPPPKDGAPPPKKEDKKKKTCKKADKHIDEHSGRRGLTTTYSRKTPRRFLQAPPPPPPLGEEDLPYCLHAEFTPEQCANLDSLPRDDTLPSELRIEVLHDEQRMPEDVSREVQEILASDDTKSRFVGCREMKAPPAPKGRDLQDEPIQDNAFEPDEGNKVEVTGVAFDSLQVVYSGSCAKQAVPLGSVCSILQSSVDIFYQSQATNPSDAEKEDMKNLLVETIKSQAMVGTFGTVGTIEDVMVGAVEDGTDGGTTNTTDRGDVVDETTKSGAGYAPYVAGVVALVVVFGVAYWYGMRGEDDEGTEAGGKKTQETSDESGPEQ